MTRCNHFDCEPGAIGLNHVAVALCALHLREWGVHHLQAESERFESPALRAMLRVAAHALHESDVDDLDEEFRAELRKEAKT